MIQRCEVLVIGGGQAGLATAFYLLRAGVSTIVVDNQEAPGGAWRHAWPSLTLFSPANASNLPGMMMPSYPGFPPAEHVVNYFSRYEQRYDIPVQRPVEIVTVTKPNDGFVAEDSEGKQWQARSVVAATGTWSAPFVPYYPGKFSGQQWHSAHYPGPDPFVGDRIAVVGGANSGAQIAAELTKVGDVTWYTQGEPRFMPDDVDGRVLFRRNRERLRAMQSGEEDPGPESALGDIVVVDSVKEGRDSGELQSHPMFSSLDEVDADHLIWCTGFRPAVGPFRSLMHGLTPEVDGLFPVGYGEALGPGSATITGVAPFAKEAARKAAERVGKTIR